MFDIEYKGGNCLIISTKEAKLITDPKLSLIGLKDLSTKNCVELLTEERFMVNDESKLVIEGPGEYGVADFEISGFPAQRHIDSVKDRLATTIYRIKIGDLRLALVGNIYEKLSEEQIEEIGLVDVFIVPVGGNGYTLDSIGAANITRKINPKVVIPIHFSGSGLKYEVPQADVSEFIKELNTPVEKTHRYKCKSNSLPPSLTIIHLERV